MKIRKKRVSTIPMAGRLEAAEKLIKRLEIALAGLKTQRDFAMNELRKAWRECAEHEARADDCEECS